MERERDIPHRRWQWTRPLLRTPRGLFAPTPSLRMTIACGLLLAALWAVVLWRGPMTWGGVIPWALFYVVLLVRVVRTRQPEGMPVVTLEGDRLVLYMPNYFGKAVAIDLGDVRVLSFYGPALSQFAVIHRDGRVERHQPAWRAAVRAQVRRFLEEALAGRVEVRQGEAPGWFEEVRGQYEP